MEVIHYDCQECSDTVTSEWICMGGRLWELVSQTSETKAMAISLLKHINGDPLITNTTLVDLCVGCGCHYTMEI